jgi:hypothetical protein
MGGVISSVGENIVLGFAVIVMLYGRGGRRLVTLLNLSMRWFSGEEQLVPSIRHYVSGAHRLVMSHLLLDVTMISLDLTSVFDHANAMSQSMVSRKCGNIWCIDEFES